MQAGDQNSLAWQRIGASIDKLAETGIIYKNGGLFGGFQLAVKPQFGYFLNTMTKKTEKMSELRFN